MKQNNEEFIERMVEKISYNISKIAHGPTSGPTGLEMLAMSIGGEGNNYPLGKAVEESIGELSRSISDSADTIAESINNLADAIRQHKN